jgi:hypothetical protein
MSQIFKLAKSAHTQCPFGSRLARFKAVDGFGVGASLSAFFSFWPGSFPPMHAAPGRTMYSGPSALLLGSL